MFANMNNIRSERDRFEKEIEDNRIRLNDSHNQKQVNSILEILEIKSSLISRISKRLYMIRQTV
jgi:hypothetical protein